MANTAVPSPLADNLDLVLRKYGQIWIWSILCTATVAVSLRAFPPSFSVTANMNLGLINRQVPLANYLAMLLALLSPAATLVAVYYLLQFLKWHLLPILFPSVPEVPGPPPTESFTFTGTPVVGAMEASPAPTAPDGPYLLYRSFAALLAGLAAELATIVFGLAMRMIV
jgi:hypothetical protein